MMAASFNGRSCPPAPSLTAVSLRCMIVDDNADFLRAACALLEGEGLRVVGVALGSAEAIRRVAEVHPDVTLVDVDLRGASGFELARRLNDDPGIDPGHLILISAHAEDDLVDLIEESPAIGFLGKPTLSAAAIEMLINDAHRGRGEVR
jgi:CheY-like chemotaxis protein